ncbi:MAG: hypothetical protein K0Q76_4259 [Panacagrimonas sp.]|nr:hypothetical protein [Panacagrimonas sp.]
MPRSMARDVLGKNTQGTAGPASYSLAMAPSKLRYRISHLWFCIAFPALLFVVCVCRYSPSRSWPIDT